MNARGERRRAEIVAAAGEILLHEGFGAVGHRAVAARADVPLGATTYYFKSREDLVAQGLRHMAEVAAARARTIADAFTADPEPTEPGPTEPEATEPGSTDPGPTKPGPTEPGALARTITRLVGAPADDTDPAPLLAFYERYVEAGRHPAYAEIVQDWNARIVTLIAEVLHAAGHPADHDRARLVLALTDGLFIGAIAERSPTPFQQTSQALQSALDGLLQATR